MKLDRVLELAYLAAVENWAKEKEYLDKYESDWGIIRERKAWLEVEEIGQMIRNIKEDKE